MSIRFVFLALVSFTLQPDILTAQEPIAQQADFNITLLSNRQIEFPPTTNDQYHRYSDIWGYVATDGTEYAIIGTGIGTSIYKLSDPADPELVASIPASLSRWRDYKTYGDFIFGVADEGADGLLIVDMAAAPDSIDWSYWRPSLVIGADQAQSLDKCHNLYIDSTFVFLAGCNLHGGGILILDLANNPKQPEFVATGDRKYAHDVFAQGTRMYTSDLSQGFAIVDISDISHPQTLGTLETSFDFTHNAWASDDGTYLFTTDERPGAMVDAYDISNIDEIVLLDRYRPSATLRNSVIPHNVHYYQGYLVISYYMDGVKIVDAHEPENLAEVASFDTYRFRDDGFHGAWGAYPYLPSGLLLVSDIESGLYVLQPQYQRASYLSGQVSDAGDASPLDNVRISIDSDRPGTTTTGPLGDYKLGWAGSGLVNIEFEKYGYHTKVLEVDLLQAQNTSIDVQLVPLKQFTISGQVLDADNLPIANAQIVVLNDAYEERTETNAEGVFQIDAYEGNTIVAAGHWGYIHQFEELNLAADQSDIHLVLNQGYRDDFIFDYGWTSSNSVNTQISQGWERGNPRYAIYNGELTNPNGDLPNDLGNECFVTGLAGNLGANLSDTSILVSPRFDLSEYSDPFINYFTWFYDFGVLPSDDSLKIYLGDGEKEILIENISNSFSGWRTQSQIRVLDFSSLSSEMYLKVVAADLGNIHIYEAALDAFSISEGETTATTEEEFNLGFTVYPNPAKSILNFLSPGQEINEIQIYDITGKIILEDSKLNTTFVSVEQLKPGTYLLALLTRGKLVGLQKFIKN